MSHAEPHRLMVAPSAAQTLAPPSPEALAMRQLRHQTKNALQRIIAQVSCCGLDAVPGGSLLREELERRVRLTARISDALFGLTVAPGSLEARLTSLAAGVVDLLGDGTQSIETVVRVVGPCPQRLHDVVLQVAHEMLGNAVKHGMHVRLVGRIAVELRRTREGGVALTVTDDGWGPLPTAEDGEGCAVMQALAARHGGRISLRREDEETVARLVLPGAG